MTYKINKTFADAANGAVNADSLKAEIAALPEVVADASDFNGAVLWHDDFPETSVVELFFSQEPDQSTKDAVDAAFSAHSGAGLPNVTFIASSKIIEDSKVVGQTGVWQDLGGACTDVSFWAGQGVQFVMGQLNGQVKTNADDGELQIIHDDGTTETVIGSFVCPDTGGEWQLFQFFTDAPPVPGLSLYKIQGKRGGMISSFEIRYSTLSLFIAKP